MASNFRLYTCKCCGCYPHRPLEGESPEPLKPCDHCQYDLSDSPFVIEDRLEYIKYLLVTNKPHGPTKGRADAKEILKIKLEAMQEGACIETRFDIKSMTLLERQRFHDAIARVFTVNVNNFHDINTIPELVEFIWENSEKAYWNAKYIPTMNTSSNTGKS